MQLVAVSVSVHLFPKNYKYIIYTKLNYEAKRRPPLRLKAAGMVATSINN